ncbi:bifunctional DNA primase/polymerase [Fluviibacterium sp. DFM31]|uniref:Bifunctional DNA primase/polymerase n=1 Tax=Meridianimarinicoccus marinus TaxID=3231483 RepID=A0ABV3L6E2_9RHOB
MAAPVKPPPDRPKDQRGAERRPEPAGFETFELAAAQLLDNGYAPLPILPGTKRPALSRWSTVAIDAASVQDWSARYPDCGVGLRTGNLVGLDIDLLDPDQAHEVCAEAVRRFGEAPTRVGLWPKRLLLYRTVQPFAKRKLGAIEVLGTGQQFVAFGRHPGTGRPYYWPQGDTPLDIPLQELPEIDAAGIETFLGDMAARLDLRNRPARGGKRASRGTPAATGPVRNEDGLVIDGRDSWLSSITWHALHDALDIGDDPEPDRLAARAWDRFCATTDLGRPRQDGGRGYDLGDARRKIADKLRLHREDRLAPRSGCEARPDYDPPVLDVVGARDRLETYMEGACRQILQWHEGGRTQMPPRIGIRATVGLGKSRIALTHLARLRAKLGAAGHPDRLLILVPSHALAEEMADHGRGTGLKIAVHRGYERADPGSGQPLCRDIDGIRAALAAGLPPQTTICQDSDGRSCQFLNGCLKQENRCDVAAADIIVAAYDVLFSGLPISSAQLAAILIDEGCWSRALRKTADICLAPPRAADPGTALARNVAALRLADGDALRKRLHAACVSCIGRPLTRRALEAAGLSADMCQLAERLEFRGMISPNLCPGQDRRARSEGMKRALENQRAKDLARMWRAVAGLCGSPNRSAGCVEVRAGQGAAGELRIDLTELMAPHPSFQPVPILHLDATLRPEMATCVLPGLATQTVEASAPHMSVKLVAGGFSKAALLGRGARDKARTALLEDCVAYVRWQSHRYAPGRVLVVTHKACESAFRSIPGVETGHFNALAGIDQFGDVAVIIVVGRPLPSSEALVPFCAAYDGSVPKGGYQKQMAGIHMRDGSTRTVRVIRHEDPKAERVRAAICDDELVQVIGRGRGVNRTAANPLDVHLLADVALPLVHDRLAAWDLERPDVVQRMLLAGLAVDSPADAAVLHPELFRNVEQAKKALARTPFKGQTPMNTSYREMSLKYACYQRSGRGRSWQGVWWIEGCVEDPRGGLEAVLGDLAGWKPSQGSAEGT